MITIYKKRFVALVLLGSAFATDAVQAQESACELEGTTPAAHRDYLQCLDSALQGAERQLQAWSNKRRLQLETEAKHSGLTQALDIFLRAEQSFETYLEDSCRWRYVRLLPDSQKAAGVYKQCKLHMFEQRMASHKLALD
ncbi:lysozyme inhibitor LprI family protein [Pseudoalteromonas sp. T1lg48]|uniref:lysozyme inhibitor LprI family protein n=1 Tax=Pseudoalteromonas sp. T1lg48 TaxID=2077100 RepID=UPI000CF7361A|nr:lysozyme inhibitor LprI family protein [Pseudoalteromonas sp. T1lg48]